MEHTILETVGKIAGLGGLALGVFLLLFRDVIRKKIFPNLTRSQAFRLLMLVLVLVWSVALAGIAAWVYVTVSNSGPSGPTDLETSLSELVPLLELRAQQIISQLREF
jgi:nitrate reductase gamma subunit